MAGTLYLCATPIGNLQDMTPRAAEALRNVDLIAAEDTRNSIRLLNHFDIHTPMTSYHEYNRVEKERSSSAFCRRERISPWSRMRERPPFLIPARCWSECARRPGSL